MAVVFKFKVELNRTLTSEEFDVLCAAVLAQCEDIVVDHDRVDIGYVVDSEEFEVSGSEPNE